MIGGMLSAMTNHRFELRQSETLQSGLEELSARHVDVILLNLSLPDSDGLATLSKAIAVASGIPIIVLTGLRVTSVLDETTPPTRLSLPPKSQIPPNIFPPQSLA